MWSFSRSRVGALIILLAAATGAVFAVHPYVSHAQATDIAAKRAQLQAQLDDLEKQIAQTQGTLDTLHGEGQSIQRDINILDADIKKSQLQIQATQVQIDALAQNIVVHTNTIGELSGDLESEKQSLAQIIRSTNEIDDYSLVEVVMSAEDVSTFFSDLDSYVSLKQAIGQSSTQLSKTRDATETEKDALVDQKTQQEQLRSVQAQEKAKLQSQEDQKAQLLAANKQQAAHYQSIFDTQQKTAAQIRAELFALAGGSGQIPLPTAITLAKAAGAATGVRPALILGILKQETNLGENVGQCLLTNTPNKGDGKGKNTGTPFSGVMKPTRDVDPFMSITASLGIDWQSQPVSCPPSYGYGGAMGPGQFIPSTWVLYATRVASLAGHPGTPANPWNNMDAFTATAMLMADNGATSQTPAAEREAALRYFAGWGNADNPAYAFYGDSVMQFAAQFQSDIDTLGS
jgi:membrane-bound lytic murein transglycosylase B